MSITAIDAKRRMVEVDTPVGPMPSPTSILELATEAKPIPRYITASSYGAAVNALREKGYTWKEVMHWLRERGVDLSQQGIVSGWRTWLRSKDD